MLARLFEHLFPIKDPVVIFAIVLVLMLAAPMLMARLNLPGMIGLLLAGAVLGPNGLGILARDQSFILLGAVGLLYIMFTAALEVDLAVFKRYRVQGAVFGVLTFSLPQGIGTVVAYYVLDFDWPAAILLASMFASHTLLAYPIVSRLGLSKNQAVTTTIGGTMVTDTAALMVLAVIAGSVRGEVNEAFWWRLGISLTVFVVGILVGLPRIGRWFFRRMAKDGPGEFVFVLTSVFICAALSEVAGVEPIVGAFLAGIALNRLIPHTGALMNRIVFTGEAIFIPFFLLSVGMLLDAKVLFGGVRTWIVAAAMVITVTLTKYLAAEGARLVFGFSKDEGRVVFGLSVAQAAATLAAVMVGHKIGLFDETVVNGTIVMILATCILGPWVVDRHAKRMAAAEKGRVEEGGEQQRILVPIVDAASAKPAVEFAMLLRGEGPSPLYPVIVAQDGENVGAHVAEGERTLAQVATLASGADVPTQGLTRVDVTIAAAILRSRKELRITDIVASWDGRVSSEARIFGSVLDEVAADRAVTLCVTRQPHPLNITTRVLLLVPPGAETDVCFETGISAAKRLARQLGAPLHAFLLPHDPKGLFKRIKAVRPGCKVVSSPLDDWDSVLQTLEQRIQENDLVVLLGFREDSPVSTEATRTLPRRVAARFPETNQVTIFGAEAKSSPREVPESLAEPIEQSVLSKDQIVLGLEDLPLEAIIARVCAHARVRWPNERPPGEAAYPAIAATAHELGPGVVLLEHRDKHLEEDSLWLGVSRSGVENASWTWKAHLFFVVFGPEHSVDRDEWIQRLTELARDRQRTEEVRFATTLDGVVTALKDRPVTPDPVPRSSRLPAA
jgi:Kef-type K+ transport system membrane component KefB